MEMKIRSLLLTIGLTCLITGPQFMTHADEGMWLFTNPPRQLLKQRYGFDVTDQWLEHVQKASVRFNSGGSGSFVSEDGLVMSNHHVGADTLQKVSTKEHDYLKIGFSARTQAEEIPAKDLELNVLMSMEDVTARVNGAVKSGMSGEEAFMARRAVMAEIERESKEKTGLRSDVVTLYQGGLYHLYRYKRYTDIRLVFAPEQGIAFFGGDTDNFEFPRYNLDVCFFRAYEGGKPAKVEHYFTWSRQGPKEGNLVFVTGHPGTTQRLETLARLKSRRDHSHPYMLYRLRTLEAILRQFAEQGPEHARRAATDIHRVANARKAFTGQFQGLLDPAVLARKAEEEKSLRARFRKADGKQSADPWRQIEEAQTKLA